MATPVTSRDGLAEYALDRILALLASLPGVPALRDDDVIRFVDVRRLMGKGLGWVDVHLLAAAVVSRERLWTKDRRLSDAAARLGVAS